MHALILAMVSLQQDKSFYVFGIKALDELSVLVMHLQVLVARFSASQGQAGLLQWLIEFNEFISECIGPKQDESFFLLWFKIFNKVSMSFFHGQISVTGVCVVEREARRQALLRESYAFISEWFFQLDKSFLLVFIQFGHELGLLWGRVDE